MDTALLHRHTEDVFSMVFPLRFCGLNLGRRVTLLRIPGDRLVIHSTGPFSAEHLEAITKIGHPEFLLDATTMHDTFSREGRAAIPDAAYFVPEGFPEKAAGPEARALSELDAITDGAFQTQRLEGMRHLKEYACFHPASRTLIVCDLLFNLVASRGYTRWAMRYLLGVKEWPAVDRPVRWAVKDRDAFLGSIGRIMEWDFDRVIVAHGSVIEENGKQACADAFTRAGYPDFCLSA